MHRLACLYAKWLATECGPSQTAVAVWLLVLCPIAVLLAALSGIPGVQALRRGVPFDGSFTWVGSDKYGHTGVSTYPMRPILTVDTIIFFLGIPLFLSALAFVLGWFGREQWDEGAP